jgi:predicted CopG family antitoxin
MAFVHDSCMSKTITIEDDIYKTLVSLKGPGDSFTKVLRRHVFVPAKSNGELLDWQESQPSPQINLEVLDVIEKGRGRRSGGRK